MRTSITAVIALSLITSVGIIGCGDGGAAGSSSPSGSAAPAKTASAKKSADAAAPAASASTKAAAPAESAAAPVAEAAIPDPPAAASDDPAAVGASATGDAAPSADGADVEQYEDQVAQTGSLYTRKGLTIYKAADATTPAQGRVGGHTLVNIKAYRGGWVLIEWPSAPEKLSLGWVEEDWKGKAFETTKDMFSPKFHKVVWHEHVKIKFEEHRRGHDKVVIEEKGGKDKVIVEEKGGKKEVVVEGPGKKEVIIKK